MTVLLAGLPVSADALAQANKAAPGGEAAAQAANAGIQRSYAAGTRAFEAGDMAGAERNLSVALAGGGLPNPQMARALYMRGSAYRQMGQPAQAISDLTTAIWLKGGLSAEDKAKATEARQLAYREAGLGDTPPPIGGAPLDQGTATAGAAPKPATSGTGTQVVQVTQQSFWGGFALPSMPSMPSLTGGSTPAAPAPQASVAPAPDAAPAQPSSFWSFLPSLGGGSAAPSEAAAPAAMAAADPAFATTVTSTPDGAPALGFATAATPTPAATLVAQSAPWDTQTAASAAPQRAAGYVPPPDAAGLTPLSAPAAAAEAAPAASSWGNPLAGTGQAVSGFFGNIFGSGSAAPQTASAEPVALTTGSTGAGGPGWGSETTVVTSQTSSMVQRGPDVPAAPSAVAPETELPWTSGATPSAAGAQPVQVAAASQGGKYKLQVAAVRSRAEADKLAQSLQSYPAVRDGSVSTEVDETVIGSMGTFYRVRLGPYASAKEPDQLCKTLKPQGFDCLVVTQ